MACATLKRAHDWDPLGSPSNSPTANGSSSPSNTTSSHHHQRPAKRHCSNHSSSFPVREPSPFFEVEPKITSGKTSEIIVLSLKAILILSLFDLQMKSVLELTKK